MFKGFMGLAPWFHFRHLWFPQVGVLDLGFSGVQSPLTPQGNFSWFYNILQLDLHLSSWILPKRSKRNLGVLIRCRDDWHLLAPKREARGTWHWIHCQLIQFVPSQKMQCRAAVSSIVSMPSRCRQLVLWLGFSFPGTVITFFEVNRAACDLPLCFGDRIWDDMKGMQIRVIIVSTISICMHGPVRIQ